MAQAYYPSGSTWKEWSADMVNALSYKVTTDANLDNSKSTGLYTVNSSSLTSSGAATPFKGYFSMILSNSDIGTPFQIAFPDAQNYIYKKINASSTWSKMNAGYADSAYSSTISTTASKIGRNGDTGVPMTFNWSGQSGQPSWLWGGNDGTNMYVYNPANFSVNYAASAGSARYITDGVTIGSDYTTAIRTTVNGTYDTRSFIKPIRCDTASVNGAPQYGSGICFGRADTQGYLYVPYYSPGEAYIGGGNGDKLNWVRRIVLQGDSVSWNNITDKPSTYNPAGHTHSYLPLSGGTLTGSVTFANATWNVVGDDSAIGDQNIGGTLCVKGCNGTPAIKLFNSDNTQYADVYHTANTVGLCHVGSSAPSDNNTKIWIQT